MSDKTKTAVVLSPIAIKRLGAACVAESLTQSEIVEWLINDRLKEYNVATPAAANRIDVANPSRKRRSAAPVMDPESAGEAGHVSASAMAAL